MKKLLKRIIPIIFLVPLFTGTIGYLIAGEKLTDSLYASFALFFTNPVSDAYNYYIEAARWTAPLVTATAILCALQKVWNSIYDRFYLLGRKDSVAVYSDEECEILFDKKVQAIYPGEHFKSYAKSHIIMFSTDQQSMEFYRIHKKDLKGKKVYIGIRNIELGLFDEVEHVELFDVNSTIARLLWKEIAVWKEQKETMDIVICGNGTLAETILSSGLQLNLFSLKQKLKYHFISDSMQYQIRHANMNLMNADEIHYYTFSDLHIWDVISNADVVIVADRMDSGLMQTLVVRARDKKIYYYSPKDGDVESYISFGSLIPFGRTEEVYTDDNIRRKSLIQNAIALNKQYADQYGSEGDWNKLAGFFKASNISSADYGEVLAFLTDGTKEEELSELEHIRWCRFYLLNYYVLGKEKDNKKRIHKDLVPYGQLTEEEKKKDRDTINLTRRISG